MGSGQCGMKSKIGVKRNQEGEGLPGLNIVGSHMLHHVVCLHCSNCCGAVKKSKSA